MKEEDEDVIEDEIKCFLFFISERNFTFKILKNSTYDSFNTAACHVEAHWSSALR